MVKKNDFSLIFWIHLFSAITFTFSFILFSWYLIIAGILIFYLQIWTFGNCIHTINEFNSKSNKSSWYHYYLNKAGININRKRVNFFIVYIKPVIVLCLALIIQIAFKINPLII